MITTDKVSAPFEQQYTHIVRKQCINILAAGSRPIALFPQSLIRVIVSTHASRVLLREFRKTLRAIWTQPIAIQNSRATVGEVGRGTFEIHASTVRVRQFFVAKMPVFKFFIRIWWNNFLPAEESLNSVVNTRFRRRYRPPKKHLLYDSVKYLYCNRLEAKGW
jgi:hypothetical protein